MPPTVSFPALTSPMLFDPQDCSSSEEYTVAAALLPLSTVFYRVRKFILKMYLSSISLTFIIMHANHCSVKCTVSVQPKKNPKYIQIFLIYRQWFLDMHIL